MTTFKCRLCSSTKHMAKGLCNRCYLEKWRANLTAEQRERWTRYKHRWFRRDKQKDPEKYRLRRELRYHGGCRQEVLKRDGNRCAECGRKLPKGQLVAHHLDMTGRYHPVRKHGEQHERTMCRRCHIAAHRRTLDAARAGVKQHHGWSAGYAKCSECGTTERKHYARGLCGRCWSRDYYEKVVRFKRKKIQSNLHGDMQQPKAKKG